MAAQPKILKDFTLPTECHNSTLEFAYLNDTDNGWQMLENSTSRPDFNITRVKFDHDIEVSQIGAKSSAAVTVRWRRTTYTTPAISVSANQKAVHLVFLADWPGDVTHSSLDGAQNLSLFKLMNGAQARIRLTVHFPVKPISRSAPRLKQRLEYLTTVRVSAMPEAPEGQFISQMRQVREKEMEAPRAPFSPPMAQTMLTLARRPSTSTGASNNAQQERARLLTEIRREREQEEAKLLAEEQHAIAQAIAQIKRDFEAKRTANNTDSARREADINARFR